MCLQIALGVAFAQIFQYTSFRWIYMSVSARFGLKGYTHVRLEVLAFQMIISIGNTSHSTDFLLLTFLPKLDAFSF